MTQDHDIELELDPDFDSFATECATKAREYKKQADATTNTDERLKFLEEEKEWLQMTLSFLPDDKNYITLLSNCLLNQAACLFNQGKDLFQQGKTKEALEQFLKAEEINPESTEYAAAVMICLKATEEPHPPAVH